METSRTKLHSDRNLPTRLKPFVRSLLQLSILLAIPIHLHALTHAADPANFESTIAPLFIDHCLECHQGVDASGGLSLTTRDGLILGGESGRAIDLDDVEASELIWRLREGEMPPPKKGVSQRLSDREIDALRGWLAEGASWPQNRELDWLERTSRYRGGRDWWSFQPIDKPDLPSSSSRLQTGNPIDTFVRSELATRELKPADMADKRTLVRRLYYDLLGLPPTLEEIEAFEADCSPDAWERLVERLLASPRYGERWARYWLDLARFAETSGYERDQEKSFAWKYRDWVVNALNSDMPFDQFIVEQIAGDEVQNRCEQSVIATGFLRLGTWNDEPNDPLDYQYDRLEDLVHTTTSAFLGLTVKCARCHAHKFDPVSQEDYYRVASIFWAGPIGQRSRSLLGGPSSDEIGIKEVLGWTDLSPEPAPLHLLKNGERSSPQQEIIPSTISTIPALQRAMAPPPQGSLTSTRRHQFAKWVADPQNPLTYRVMVNRIWLHHFGQGIVRTPNNFGFLADPPTHPQLLEWLAAEFIESGGSIKHMHRLILNSQTWRQASLHAEQDHYKSIDSTNRLLWSAERRRLDAEAIRDSMLVASEQLDLRVGGESFKPSISEEALEGLSRRSSDWQASPAIEQQRRSLYTYMKRGLLPPMMTAFDLCDATQSCGQRDLTIAPTQALVLLNNSFVHQCSESLAAKISGRTSCVEEQINRVWTHILKRLPSDDERILARRHLQTQQEIFSEEAGRQAPLSGPSIDDKLSSEDLALASLCHVLFNSNEFVFVD